MERSADLPTVGSYSTMVFQIEDALYTVGWNNQKKNLYKYNITGAYWKVDEDFTIWIFKYSKFQIIKNYII